MIGLHATQVSQTQPTEAIPASTSSHSSFHVDNVEGDDCHHAVVVLCRQGFEAKAQALEASHIQASGAVDRSKISIEAKQRAEDDIRRDVEIAKLGAENALVERVRVC